ncbi:hypothetical protein ACTFSP_23825 [Bacillus cereus group sp. MYBK108-2]|uniref:hypothetical protein n=1 Tax=unclassified Bacillus cereus group TaxID=2750818 RepID=UPI003F791E6E
MAVLVTYVGTSPIPGTSSAYKIWTYNITTTPGGGSGEIKQGQRWAFALPSNINVQDPSFFPDVNILKGTFVTPDPENDRQYVGGTVIDDGSLTINFVAPARTSSGQVSLFKYSPGEHWVSVPFAATPTGTPNNTQNLPLPAAGAPAYTGRPVHDFVGTLPYASELFGVYQPLAGLIGLQCGLSAAAVHPESVFGELSSEQFKGDSARTLKDKVLAALVERYETEPTGVLSPVGLVNLFREYFFEFDTFLGKPAGHIWVSPGGTVEVVETSTRRTLVEKVAELSEEISRKTEESLTNQDDVADAIKEENSNDTKLGVSATGGVSTPIYHADASASFSTQNTVKRASETMHKRTRTQTAKVTSEIKRNFRTSFKTVTEATDISSRRYILQNSTTELVNYEMRRKMRKVGVQLQHVGTRLCWQLYIGDPGKDLGLGDMVHVVEGPDLTAIKKPEKLPDPEPKQVTFRFNVPFKPKPGTDEDAKLTYTPHPQNACRGLNPTSPGIDDTIQFCFEEPLPPPPRDYELSKVFSVDRQGAQVDLLQPTLHPTTNTIKVQLTFVNFQGRKSLPLDIVLLYEPTEALKQKINTLNAEAEAAYKKEVAQLQHEAYGKAVRERLQLISSMRTRSPEDLRSEERRSVFRSLIRRLGELGHYPQNPQQLPYLESEQIQQFFDVDEMLYFVAPDFWRPGPLCSPPPTKNSVGRYPVPPEEEPVAGTKTLPLAGQTVAGWYSRADEYKAMNSVEVACLTINSAPTTVGDITVTLNGVTQNVAIDPSVQLTATDVATLIRGTSFSGWTTSGKGVTVTFTATSTGPMTDATYSPGSTGAAGIMTTTIQGTSVGQEPPASEWRVNYLITEQTQPAPMGSSLGWLIQIDGDERRNEFLNAAWAKAILPIRPGQEATAIDWITKVEGEVALGRDYCYQEGDPEEFRGKKVGEVLKIIAKQLKEANKDYKKTLASEKVFETGFDPLKGGFRPAEPYEVFDQWIEILPTDQVAAVAVRYDPKTGQQI